MKTRNLIIAVLMLCIAGSSVFGQNVARYSYVPLRQLAIEGFWPDAEPTTRRLNWQQRRFLKYYIPYAVGSNGEEIYIDVSQAIPQDRWNRWSIMPIESVTHLLDGCYLAIKTETDLPPSGTLYLPKPDLSGMVELPFKLTGSSNEDTRESGQKEFYRAMQHHYEFLQNEGFTGAAWFRYRAGQARQILEQDDAFDPNALQADTQSPRRDALDEGMSLFTGAAAVRENIQLDRMLQTRLNEPRVIPVSGLDGITTAQIDWKGLVTGEVKKDPLARYIPADQHVIFYPTFKSMMLVMDQVKSGRTLAMPIDMAVDHIERYEQQMCVWLDGWSRLWGPKTIKGVAMTGSDPYMQAGTDSAVLFDARTTALVYNNTESKQDEKLKAVKGAKKLTGTIDGVAYRAVVSPDRAVSSYLAAVDDVVVVTNSLAQLEKIIHTAHSAKPSMDSLDEYTFFRSRYPLDEAKQSAFLVMSDAAIRRWCSPQWRIGAARRTMAAAVLSQVQAEYLDKGEAFDLSAAQTQARSWAPDIGDITLTEAGVTSSVYGNLGFMTPIIELPIDKVSKPEQEAYRRFRQNYQRQWQLYFDPIAVSLRLDETTIDVDMTVRPLVAATAYRPYVQIAGNHTIQAGDGDVHPQSLIQLILAVDSESDTLRQAGGFAMQMMNQDINALGWMGRWITLYADDDPLWEELSHKLKSDSDQSDFEDFMQNNLNRIPVALAMDVDNGAKLALFLVSLRAFIQQTAPDMTAWETLVYNEKSYVKVTVKYDKEKLPALYYAILPDSLIVSLHEDLIKRSIDRSLSPTKEPDRQYRWLGENLAARVDEKAWPVIEMLAHEQYARQLQMQAWNNLPILNEWHARSKDMSLAGFHKRYWHTKPICPGGGEYAWDERYQTAASSVFGHPAEPRMPEDVKTPLAKTKDVQLGITFEADGLRVKTIMTREH